MEVGPQMQREVRAVRMSLLGGGLRESPGRLRRFVPETLA